PVVILNLSPAPVYQVTNALLVAVLDRQLGCFGEVAEKVGFRSNVVQRDVRTVQGIDEPLLLFVHLTLRTHQELLGKLEQSVEKWPLSVTEFRPEYVHYRRDRISILLEHRKRGVERPHATAQPGHLGQPGVIPMWVENDDRIVLACNLLDDPAGRPALSRPGHRQNCQVAGHDVVSIHEDVDIGSIAEVREVDGPLRVLLQIPDDYSGDIRRVR